MVGSFNAKLLGVVALAVLVSCAKVAGLENSEDGPNGAGDTSGGTTAPTELVEVSPQLAFGDAACGKSSDAALSIKNTGDKPIDYEVTLPEGASVFTLRDGPASGKGTVLAHQEAQVFVRVTSSKAGQSSAQLVVTTNGRARTVDASVLVKGADLKITPPLIDFGEVRKLTETTPQNVEIENTGNEVVKITGFGTSPDFTLGTGPITINPGEKQVVAVRFTSGPEGSALKAELAPQTEAPTCNPAPKLTLQGQRVSTDVTVNPLTLDFAEVDCDGQSTLTRTVTVLNYGTVPIAGAIVLPGGPAASWYTTSAVDFSVAPALNNQPGKQDIIIGVKKMPSSITATPHEESIAVKLQTPQGEVIKTPKASVKSVGAVLDISPGTLTNVNSNTFGKTFSIRNTGNKYIYLRHISSSTRFDVTNNSDLDPNERRDVRVEIDTDSSGFHETDIQTSKTNAPPGRPASGMLCTPAINVKVSGTKYSSGGSSNGGSNGGGGGGGG